jgi:hypothetical protein
MYGFDTYRSSVVVAGVGAGRTSWSATSAPGRPRWSAAIPGDAAQWGVMPDELTRGAFEPHVGTRFRLSRPAAVELELAEVRDLGVAAGDPGRSFVVLFRGPGDAPLAQGTYEVEHDSLGAFALFLVPVGVDERGVQYEAVFNRLPPR